MHSSHWLAHHELFVMPDLAEEIFKWFDARRRHDSSSVSLSCRGHFWFIINPYKETVSRRPFISLTWRHPAFRYLTQTVTLSFTHSRLVVASTPYIAFHCSSWSR